MKLYFKVPPEADGMLLRGFLRRCSVSTDLSRAVKFRGSGFFADGAPILANRRVEAGQVISFELPPEEERRASFWKNLDVLAIRFQVLFADGNLKVVAMIGRRYGRIPYGFYGRTEIFPGVSRREYKAEKERIGNCAMVVQPKTKSDLSKNRSLHYFVTPTGLKPVTF